MNKTVKKYDITSEMIAKWFKYSSTNSFDASNGKEKIINALEKVIKHVEETIIERIGE